MIDIDTVIDRWTDRWMESIDSQTDRRVDRCTYIYRYKVDRARFRHKRYFYFRSLD